MDNLLDTSTLAGMANEQPQPEAGWYAAPGMPGARRYWNGSEWTEHVAPTPNAGVDGSALGTLIVVVLAVGIAVLVLFVAAAVVRG